jgi:DNA-binding transcriptional MerR regulator
VDESECKDDRLILPREAAAQFGVKSKTLRRWHGLGLIGARRTLGGQRRYWESEVRARVAELDEVVSEASATVAAEAVA